MLIMSVGFTSKTCPWLVFDSNVAPVEANGCSMNGYIAGCAVGVCTAVYIYSNN